MLLFLLLALLCLFVLPGRDETGSDRSIRIVGSGTVFVFSVRVAEAFARLCGAKTPIVESTGTGAGVSLLCASGSSAQGPDVANASRSMKPSELSRCRRNGVDPLRITIGYDGIVLIERRGGAHPFFSHMSCKALYLALSKYHATPLGGIVKNPYTAWRQADPALPNLPIVVYGPSPISGTRDVFVDLCLRSGALQVPEVLALRAKDRELFDKVTTVVREDGAYVEVSDNFNLVLQKVNDGNGVLGVVGYNYYLSSRESVYAVPLGGVLPNESTIRSGLYPLSRPLFMYVDANRLSLKPDLLRYVRFFTSAYVVGQDGLLASMGLTPMGDEERLSQEAYLRGRYA